MRSLIEVVMERYHCGFQDGGCVVLAGSLVRWLGHGACLAAIYRSGGGPVQHACARLGGIFLDSDGVATQKEILDKMSLTTFEPGPCYVVGRFNPDRLGDETPNDDEVVELLVSGIEGILHRQTLLSMLGELTFGGFGPPDPCSTVGEPATTVHRLSI